MARIEFRPPPSVNDHTPPDPAVPRDLGDARVLISHWPPVDWGLANALEWIQLDSAGVDYLASNDVWSRDVMVTNGAGAYAVQLAQYVMSNLLAVNEKHVERAQAQTNRHWPQRGTEHDGMVGRLLRGQTMVILGYGGVGRELARLASCFGMRIIAIKAHPEVRADDSFCLPGTGDPDGSIPEAILGTDSLMDSARSADVLAITAPLTDRTRHIVDATVLGALPPWSWVINVGRGAVIDEGALIEELRTRRIGGAILDVFEVEPLSGSSPLWRLPNVVVTPHAAGGGDPSMDLLSYLVAENLYRYATGERLRNLVDPVARY
jgi:phosphoglycerate dehydrogenase-like enzyme